MLSPVKRKKRRNKVMKKQFEKPEVVVICFTKETITSASGYSASGVYDGGGSGWTDFGG